MRIEPESLSPETMERIMTGLRKIAQLMNEFVENIKKAFFKFASFFATYEAAVARANTPSWQKFNRPITERRRM